MRSTGSVWISAIRAAAAGTRSRTCQAILDAAAAVWARDFGAALADVATQAQVSRSTLHRYFPERQDLVEALLADSLEQMMQLDDHAGGAQPTAVDRLQAMLHQLVQIGDRVMFLFADPDRFKGHPLWEEGDSSMVPLIQQAQGEGGLAADLEPDWIQGVYYALVYTAAELASQGQMPRHVAAERAARTFIGGCAPQASIPQI